MKKILFLSIVLICAMCGCDEVDENGVAHAKVIKCDNSTTLCGKFYILDIESHGEIHEYLTRRDGHRGGITHLPNCKYCKERY